MTAVQNGLWGRNDEAFQWFMELPQGDKVQATYIWIGGSGEDIRSKTKTLPEAVRSLRDIPPWNFDGSSTLQAPGDDSEVWLEPVRYWPDPFRRGNNILVLCECLHPLTKKPLESNTRSKAQSIFEKEDVQNERPWYGIEQEYTLFEADGVTPLGWPQFGYPGPQGDYYSGNGTRRAYGRQVCEAHYRCCQYAGLNISGMNSEALPGQWEYQVGPCEGIDCGDQTWLARWLLERVAENFQVVVSFHPKPIKGNWKGASGHANYSTKSMRAEGGMKAVTENIEKLRMRHAEHMQEYGMYNEERMLGTLKSSRIDKFTVGRADRTASVRIPNVTEREGKGYFEDRRPASNMDPYVVSSLIAYTTIVWEEEKTE